MCSKSVENSYLISDTRSTFAIAQTPVDTLSELVLKHCIIKIPHKSGHKLVTIDDCYMSPQNNSSTRRGSGSER